MTGLEAVVLPLHQIPREIEKGAPFGTPSEVSQVLNIYLEILKGRSYSSPGTSDRGQRRREGTRGSSPMLGALWRSRFAVRTSWEHLYHETRGCQDNARKNIADLREGRERAPRGIRTLDQRSRSRCSDQTELWGLVAEPPFRVTPPGPGRRDSNPHLLE
jgi:hypothetical protein